MFNIEFFVVLTFQSVACNLCPASTSHAEGKFRSLPYPDFYSNRIESVSPSFKSFNCSDRSHKIPKTYKCVYSNNCQISSAHVDSILSANLQWRNRSPDLCDSLIRSTGADNFSRPIKVFFFGGSHTIGTWSHGCCCDRFLGEPDKFMTNSIDANCPAELSCTNNSYIRQEINGHTAQYCSWAGYFGRWLKMQFPDRTFIDFNMAKGETIEERYYISRSFF